MSNNPAADFWQIVGTPVDFDDLKVGEVFLVERCGGKVREVSRVVARDGDDFICARADESELGETYKVMVINDA